MLTDEQCARVVEELVADRPAHRPVTQPLAGIEDLLDPDPVDAVVAEPGEVAGGVGEAVGMVDPEAGDVAFADPAEDLGVRGVEDLRVLDPEARQVVDVEMWFDLLENGDLIYTTEPLCAFRVHSLQETASNTSSGVAVREYVEFFSEYALYFGSKKGGAQS